MREGMLAHSDDSGELTLVEYQMISADMACVMARRADFTEAKMHKAMVVQTDFSDANLTRAKLGGADLRNTNLTAPISRPRICRAAT